MKYWNGDGRKIALLLGDTNLKIQKIIPYCRSLSTPDVELIYMLLYNNVALD